MSNLIKTIIIALLLFVVASCKQGSKVVDKVAPTATIQIAEAPDSVCGKHVRSIDYLPLLGSEQHIMPEVTKMIFQNQCYYLWDKERHMVVAYSDKGLFKFVIDKRGKASDEYMEIANFTVDDHNVYTIDNYRHEVSVFSAVDGSFVEKRPIDFVAWDMEWLGDDKFLFAYLPNNPNGQVNTKQSNYAVWMTDSTFETTMAEYFPYQDDYYEMIGKDTYFARVANGVAYSSYKDDGYYVFTKDGDVPLYYALDMPKPRPNAKNMPYEEVVKNGYCYLSETPRITTNYIFLAIASMGMDDVYMYSKSTRQTMVNSYSDISRAIMPPVCTMGDKVVAYLSDEGLYADLTSEGFKKCSKQGEDIFRKGGACLLIYTLD